MVKHRANEIAYIYGERKKPDYLGKLYRKIFEPVCWTLGLFCKETDWSVLPDVPLTSSQKSTMMNYRSDLRNITNGLETVEDVNAVQLPGIPVL